MGLSIVVEKVEEHQDACVYAFGGPSASVGRVRLDKSSGDIELVHVSEADTDPDQRFYLAHVVPRLHEYHDRNDYPAHDQWSA